MRKVDAPHVAREQWTVRFAPTVAKDLSPLTEGVVKIVGVGDDLPAVEACERDLRGRFGDRVSAARSQPYYVDVTHPDANKGDVVRYLSQKLGIPAEKIATIGDMPNDVLMFARSGLSVAMGNASPDVQRAARRVTELQRRRGVRQRGRALRARQRLRLVPATTTSSTPRAARESRRRRHA